MAAVDAISAHSGSGGPRPLYKEFIDKGGSLLSKSDCHIIGRVENCKSSQNQMDQCFFNGYWYIETEGIFAKKNIFDSFPMVPWC